MTSDLDLLREFARGNSQDAFAEIVRRHLNLVYSAALRQVRSPQLAEEVAQSVFADLARVAATPSSPQTLTPWLYAVTRRTAIDAIRKESVPQGLHRAEYSWILENNRPMRHILEGLNARIYKTYRIYGKPLNPVSAPASV